MVLVWSALVTCSVGRDSRTLHTYDDVDASFSCKVVGCLAEMLYKFSATHTMWTSSHLNSETMYLHIAVVLARATNSVGI